jgi:hypothetical protein
MTLGTRKLVIAGAVAFVILLANFLVLARWLDSIGLIGWARGLKAEYLTGTSLTIIVVLLVLTALHAHGRERCPTSTRFCRVCEHELSPGGRYCAACGSRA